MLLREGLFDQLRRSNYQVPWHFRQCLRAPAVRRLSESVNEMDRVQSLWQYELTHVCVCVRVIALD